MGNDLEPYKSYKLKIAGPLAGAGLVLSVFTFLPVMFVWILGIILGAILASPGKIFRA